MSTLWIETLHCNVSTPRPGRHGFFMISRFRSKLGNNWFHDHMQDILSEAFLLQRHINICYILDGPSVVSCRVNQL